MPELQDLRDRVIAYDNMIRSNATVEETINMLILPILSATYTFVPVSENKQDVEVADFVTMVIMENWQEKLRGILQMLPFGFSAFEVVFKDIVWNGQDKLGVDLNYIYQKTVYQWMVEGDRKYIVQRVDNGQRSEVDFDNLLLFSFRKLGDNYEGNSILRSAYAHWYRVQNYYKLSSIAYERGAMGIPKVEYPKNAKGAAVTKADEIASNIRTNEASYITHPEGYKVEILDMHAEGTQDPTPLINHHNIQIARAALVGFMHLGTTQNGSRAASYDMSTIFENSLDSIAKQVCEVIQTLVKRVVDYNFPGVKEYPKMQYSNLKREDMLQLADVLNKLSTASLLSPTEETEQWLRKTIGKGMPENGATPEEIAAKTQEKVKKDSKALDPMRPNEMDDEEDDKKVAADEKVESAPIQPEENQGKMAAVNDSFYRTLTASEEKVNFKNLEKKLDRDEEKLRQSLLGMTEQQVDAIIAGMLLALRSQEPLVALQGLRTELVGEYGQKVLESLRSAFDYAKITTADEMEAMLGDGEAPVPKTNADEAAKMQFKSSQIATENATKLQSNTITRAAELYSQGRSDEEIAAIVRQDVSDKQSKIIDSTVAVAVISAITQGVTFVQQTYVNKIKAYQYSAILDKRTCPFCRALDKKIIRKEDPAYFRLMPPQHFGCRCRWVEITIAEDDPQISGIPEQIDQDMGIGNFKQLDKSAQKDLL